MSKILVATYHPNVALLVPAALAQYDAGNYHQYIQRVDPADDLDGRVDAIRLLLDKIATTYGTNGMASFAICLLDEKDAYRNTEAEDYDPDYTPFCEAVGLDVLAYGTDLYGQIQADPVALAKYQTVHPDVEILDENGIGTGVFVFKRGGEFDRPQRS